MNIVSNGANLSLPLDFYPRSDLLGILLALFQAGFLLNQVTRIFLVLIDSDISDLWIRNSVLSATDLLFHANAFLDAVQFRANPRYLVSRWALN